MTDRIIVALDYDSGDRALETVDRLSGAASFFKVGLELYTAAGPQLVRSLKDRGLKVFLDLKLFDIPNTVARTSRFIASLGVDLFNVHLLAGAEVITAAGQATREEALRLAIPAPKVLGVTVLTSSGGEEWREIGIGLSVPELVTRLADRAAACGLDGVVASPLDAAGLKARFGPDFLVVSPGIRPPHVGVGFIRPESPGSMNRTPTGEKRTGRDDQKRTLTAGEAFAAGCDYIVVGRPVTQAPDPRRAFLELVNDA